MFARVRVEHELHERSLQARQVPLHHDEPCARDLARGFEIELAESFAELDMVARLEAELAWFAPLAHLGVVVLAVAGRNAVGQQVRQAEFDVAQPRLHFLQRRLVRLEPIAEILDRCEQRLDVLALRFRLADIPGAGITFALQLLGLDLQRLAAFLECQVGVGVEFEAASREIRGNLGG